MAEKNTDKLRAYTYYDNDFATLLDVMIENHKITPSSHPKIVDLAAGDGSVAALFAERGWRESNILCIDQYESPTPLVHGVSWHYLDLLDLITNINQTQKLSKEVLGMKGKFDIVAAMQVPFREYEEKTLWNFFANGNDSLIVSQYKLSRLGK